jgi:hypothetical protein
MGQGAATDGREALDFAVTVLDELLLPQLEGSGRVLLLPAASIVQVDVKSLLEVRLAGGLTREVETPLPSNSRVATT